MPKRLTLKYAAVQSFFWAAYCPMISLSAIYLQGKQYDTAKIGVLLALITIASALLQPLVAASADRSRHLTLRSYLAIPALLALLLTGAMLGLSGWALLAVFFLASIALHALEPIINAIAVYCLREGMELDFGVSRASGSLFFGITSLLVGYAAKLWGVNSMLVIGMAFTVLLLGSTAVLPRMKPNGTLRRAAQNPCTLLQFFRRYKRYTLVQIGFFFIAVFHLMTETYMINMMERIGGDSSNVGVAILCADICEFGTIFFFERFRRHLTTGGWLKLTAVFYVIKAFLFYLAPTVPLLYLAATLQAVTYGFYAPAIVHFASEEISDADMVKGQTVCVAIFTLGGSLGNYLGGALIAAYSVRIMIFVSFLFACVGAAIVLLVLRKKRPTLRQTA